MLLAACVKDTGMKKTTVFTPVFKTSDEVRAAIKSDNAEDISHPRKIYVLGNYIFVSEIGKGVHIIDNSNPASPVNKAFIHIPGNEDIAVKGNTLYADCFTDLMVIDISDPSNVSLKTYIPNMFPDRQYVFGYMVDTNTVITDWIAHDTMMDINVTEGAGIWRNGNFYTGIYTMVQDVFFAAALYNGSRNNAVPAPVGVGGSMARFAILNDHLYTVTTFQLNVLNITNSTAPKWNKTISLNSFIETIYPFKDKLFIGSQTGMLIYDVSNPESPVQQGTFEHVRSCDPVIADDNYAYVTLHAGSACGENLNRLEVLDINDITQPQLLKTYDLANPHGLSKDENILFVCDGDGGLKIFDAADVSNIQQLKRINLSETFDVICYNKIAIVSAKDGLYQYDYSNIADVKLLSKMVIAYRK
jgi:hypothetical protein